ncbi:15248_t:CDS:2, partial [Dentiscutata erythropus]
FLSPSQHSTLFSSSGPDREFVYLKYKDIDRSLRNALQCEEHHKKQKGLHWLNAEARRKHSTSRHTE